ncbi:unnamed protein product [Rotaria sordida]|uniref:HIG1 domain-containing protein n=1 Tax=Rotaria sordida TaxID=392033 RepID=A0A814CZD2_9BILA|nr:unnamed protein product [Rotaria sordida]CAF0852127.1 unnamed protein product [Rotaria sordida]CAF0947390.1 unnamed protein product [Rotaria sordida]CAF3642806.1 unnamed protein product [Rotaria sordida]CAF3743264.1 unnamed protein product [Rotaria sordida]
MSKNNNDENLEYYRAKQSAGQLSISKNETTKTSKSSSNDTILRSKSDGYIPMNESPEKQREFQRYKEITFAQKASEKAKQNPLIPIGLLTTVGALTLGLRAVSRGDKWQSQMMMRARIGAQGFTILAVLASIMYAGQSREPTQTPPKHSRSSTS